MWVIPNQDPLPEEEYEEEYIDSFGRQFPKKILEAYFPELEWYQINTIFKIWVPASDQMILHSFEYVERDTGDYNPAYRLTRSQLFLWNLVTNEIKLLSQNGVQDLFSPDGKTLAIVTLGSPRLDAQRIFIEGSAENIQLEAMPTLNLMDWSSGQVFWSMPIIGQTRNGGDIGPAPSEDTQTDGAIQPQLNVIDLTSQALLGSVPGAQEMPTWSPDNEHLVYQNPDRNWQLFDLHNHSSIPVTVGNGAQLSWPAWSFSGSYIKFWKSENGLADSYLTDTYILEIPSELP